MDELITSFAFSAVTVAASNIVRSFQCFKEGTLVETEEGLKPIEEIEAGDKVLAYDEETGEQGYKEVVRLFRNSTMVTHYLSFDDSDEPIVCTPEHPFYILNPGSETPIVNFEGRDDSKYAGQWVQAKYLKVGDKVLLSDGKTAILTKTVLEHLSDPITTYNFEVQDFHTYYVGEQGILVHNACPRPTRAEAMSEAKKYLGIADDAVPDGFDYVDIARGVRGKPYKAKVYKYGDKWIRDDMGGHRFWDKIAKKWTGHQPSHFNVGVGSIEHGQINGIHFYYR